MNNGQVILELQGSKKDFIGAWLTRFIVCGALAYIAKTGVDIRDDTRDMKKEWPQMQKDIGELKEQGKTFATKIQLEETEKRVKNEFAETLKRSKIITSTQGK
jgi:hypothetical protein